MNALALLTSAGNTSTPTYVDDVFSSYLYTGNGGTQTITNGIDLAGKGGLVISKGRSGTFSSFGSYWIDTTRGLNNPIVSSDTTAQNTGYASSNSASSTGYTLGGESPWNGSSTNYVGWTFRKAAKFFDVVTWTGTDVGNDGSVYPRTLSHNLGSVPGTIIIKRLSSTEDWAVWHQGLGGNNQFLTLNSTSTQITRNWLNNTAPTSTSFTLGFDSTYGGKNAAATYVAYLFAHDTSTDGIIQCGSFSGSVEVNLGWEAQYVLIKDPGSAGNWYVFDVMRGMSYTQGQGLFPNTSGSESAIGAFIIPTATGFKNVGGGNYIYLAIRRPNKPPTSGTQVYNAVARTGTGAAATVTGVGFAPDLFMSHTRSGTYYEHSFIDKLRGVAADILSNRTNSEASVTDGVTSFNNDGVSLGVDAGGYSINRYGDLVHHFFRRAPGVFDIVAYTGTGSATTQAHNLGVAPELMIVKSRSAVGSWWVYSSAIPASNALLLNTTDASASATGIWNSTAPTSSVFTLGSAGSNSSGTTYVNYLFATKPGISKVGSYTGNGTSQTINCGFATGARFILIKRTDSTGDWYIWDSVRGIIAANDPHLSLNTTAAEVTTDDSNDPDTSGFIVNQNTATNINVLSATYIYLSFA